MPKTILVTGGAGFIGSHVARRLLDRGDRVVIVDNFNAYYDPKLKRDRIRMLVGASPNARRLTVYRKDIAQPRTFSDVFKAHRIDAVCHLAAQAGVRHHLSSDDAYLTYRKSNVDGTLNLFECARHAGTGNVVFASTSSVYGRTKHFPFREDQNTDKPLSIYAAMKKANELFAHAYNDLFSVPMTALRFFNVYGPWGRPDNAYFIWADCIRNNKPVPVFGQGRQHRDWTYIDDIVEGVVRVLDRPQAYAVYNIGRGRAERLLDFLEYIERYMGKKAKRKLLPLQPGEVRKTFCDVSKLKHDFGYQPQVTIKDGVRNFVTWYHDYYGIR